MILPATRSNAGRLVLLASLLALSLPAQADWRDALKKAKDAVGVAKDVKTAVVGPDQSEERLIGEQAAATLLGAAPLVSDRAAQRYVNLVGHWIASHSARPELDWQFGVLDSPNVGAFAAPGGFIFVTRGLLLEMRNEAELAGVLAHEIAHVVEKHHLKALKSAARLSLARRFSGTGDQMKQLAAGARTLYGRGLDRHDEFAADAAGVALARRAGYDAYGLMAVLQTLDSLNPDDGRIALLLGTHPRPADRVSRLDGVLQDLAARDRVGDPGARRYLKNLKALGSAR